MELLEPGRAALMNKIYIWLLPAAPCRGKWQEILSRFAEEYGGARFEPHITLFSGRRDALKQGPDAALSAATIGQRPITLAPSAMKFSSEYSKSCFLKFPLTDELRTLSRRVERDLVAEEAYKLDPHLSLFYGALNAEAREKICLAAGHFTEISFDELWAVSSPLENSIASPEDVRTWRLAAAQRLS